MKRSFSWRAFTSFGLFLSFIVILLSGVILYIFPGRTPGFIWEMFGLSKPAWQNQHIIFGFVFAILSLCHLFFINWKAFFSYLKSKTKEGLQSPRELLVISLLALLCGFGTYGKIQPFSGILELGKSISNSWDSKREQAVDKRVERSGESQELAFAEIAPERGVWRDDSYGSDTYEGRGHGRERGHGHGYHHNNNTQQRAEAEVIPSAAQLSPLYQQKNAVKPVATQNIAANNPARQTGNAQAPDDELHRRTTASCSSCH